MRVHNDILVAIGKRHCVMLLLLDVSAASDTVDHDILLTRLNSKYSISGIGLEWLLYVLYTAPLADILRFHEMQFRFYADDTQLYISFSTNNDMELSNSIIKIEECLSDIDKWMSINRLKQRQDRASLLILKV